MRLYDDTYIVVTGGCGFIGSNLIKELNEQGFTHIIVVDNLSEGEKWKNLVGKEFSEVITPEKFPEWLEDHVDAVEAVVHLGACTDTTERNGDYLLSNNTNYTIQLARLCVKNNTRFLYASSAATYGLGESGFSDSSKKISHLKPLNLYGFSKHLVDLWAFEEGMENQILGLKYFNVFGPNEYHKKGMCSPVLKFYNEIQNQGFVELFQSSDPERFPDGEQLRDFIYVKDVVRLTILLIKSSLCGLVNIGTGKGTSWKFVAEHVFSALERPVDIRFTPMPQKLIGQYQNETVADTKKLQKSLKEPFNFTPVGEAIEEYVKGYLISNSYR